MSAWKRAHGPTWLVALLIHALWASLVVAHDRIPPPALFVLGGFVVAWHGSLQHETIHGFPRGPRWLRRAIAALPLSLWLPYEVYAETHRQHHRTVEHAHPDHDPESHLVAARDWNELPRVVQALLVANQTLVGRLLLGPFVTWFRFFTSELGRVFRGEGRRRGIWSRHLLLVGALLWVLNRAGMSVGEYLWCFVYPGTSLTLLRSFAEHRPAGVSEERTVVVEAGWLFRLLYLNNNLHVVHHEQPRLPWFELARAYRERGAAQSVVPGGYASLFWRFGFRPVRAPVVS